MRGKEGECINNNGEWDLGGIPESVGGGPREGVGCGERTREEGERVGAKGLGGRLGGRALSRGAIKGDWEGRKWGWVKGGEIKAGAQSG